MSEDMVIGSGDIMEHAAEAEIFLKQFANKTRLMVLCSLLKEEKSVTELLEVISVSQPVISQHLALLREAKMVATRRDGQTIYYRLADERVKRLIALMYEFFVSGAN
ncbi:transcriptional regulator [Alteromonas sp. V450]|uniref:ArsR/SmtB family transcription factor n=1 Tax=Alteromonas sp. V450 TaxID=1912139 RepID=UPI0008FF1147|nr:metalloregulator ArsR/SmtB family transcription factor [Alteromonas sp. V450]OJF68405.1 transcriptional regulator [Alteromonas sp. V450]